MPTFVRSLLAVCLLAYLLDVPSGLSAGELGTLAADTLPRAVPTTGSMPTLLAAGELPPPPASTAFPTLYWSSASGGVNWSENKWSTTSGGPYTSAWVDGANAVFEGTAGTVIQDWDMSLSSITFTTDGYSLRAIIPPYRTQAPHMWLRGLGVVITTGAGTDTIQAWMGGWLDSTTLTKNGVGTLSMPGVHLDRKSYNSDYTGGTFIDQGTMDAGGQSLGTKRVTVAAGATLMVNTSVNPDLLIGSLAGSGSVDLPGTLKVGFDNTSTAFSGNISGIGGLSKAGTGTLTLTGYNTYLDATLVASGTLAMGPDAALGGSALTVATGATCSVIIPARGRAASQGPALLNSGSTYSMDGAIGTCYLEPTTFSGIALNANNATVKIKMNSSAADCVLCALGSAKVTGTNTIAVTCLGSSLSIGARYQVVDAYAGLSGGNWQFPNGSTQQAVTVGGNNYVLQLDASDTGVWVTVTSPPSPPLPIGISMRAPGPPATTGSADDLDMRLGLGATPIQTVMR